MTRQKRGQPLAVDRELLSRDELAHRFNCSSRHIQRLVQAADALGVLTDELRQRIEPNGEEAGRG